MREMDPSAQPCSSKNSGKKMKRMAMNTSLKIMNTLSRAMNSLYTCYARTKQSYGSNVVSSTDNLNCNEENPVQQRILLLPNELLDKVMSYCDFSTLSNVRESSRRLCEIVDSMGERTPKKQIVGGVELLSNNGLGKIILKRIKDDKCIELDRAALGLMMTRISICHYLVVTRMNVDDELSELLLFPSYQSMESVVLGNLSVTNDIAIRQLVTKASPSLHLYLKSSNFASQLVLSPQVIVDSCARFTSIIGNIVATQLDDDFLVSLVTSDVLMKKQVILPVTSIGHSGISKAIQAFISQCIEIRSEATMYNCFPIIQFDICIAGSDAIDFNSIITPQGDNWFILKNLRPDGGFSIEVRVDCMSLLLNIVYPKKETCII